MCSELKEQQVLLSNEMSNVAAERRKQANQRLGTLRGKGMEDGFVPGDGEEELSRCLYGKPDRSWGMKLR